MWRGFTRRLNEGDMVKILRHERRDCLLSDRPDIELEVIL